MQGKGFEHQNTGIKLEFYPGGMKKSKFISNSIFLILGE